MDDELDGEEDDENDQLVSDGDVEAIDERGAGGGGGGGCGYGGVSMAAAVTAATAADSYEEEAPDSPQTLRVTVLLTQARTDSDCSVSRTGSEWMS